MMTYKVVRVTRRPSWPLNSRDAGHVMHCVAVAACLSGEPAKVARRLVDKVGSGVPLSGQEGICVQWR